MSLLAGADGLPAARPPPARAGRLLAGTIGACLRVGHLDLEPTTAKRLSVEHRDRGLRFGLRRHLYEPEPARLARKTIRRHCGGRDSARTAEVPTELLGSCRKRQTTNEHFERHGAPPVPHVMGHDIFRTEIHANRIAEELRRRGRNLAPRRRNCGEHLKYTRPRRRRRITLIAHGTSCGAAPIEEEAVMGKSVTPTAVPRREALIRSAVTPSAPRGARVANSWLQRPGGVPTRDHTHDLRSLGRCRDPRNRHHVAVHHERDGSEHALVWSHGDHSLWQSRRAYGPPAPPATPRVRCFRGTAEFVPSRAPVLAKAECHARAKELSTCGGPGWGRRGRPSCGSGVTRLFEQPAG